MACVTLGAGCLLIARADGRKSNWPLTGAWAATSLLAWRSEDSREALERPEEDWL
jgi:hypothetical protein